VITNPVNAIGYEGKRYDVPIIEEYQGG